MKKEKKVRSQRSKNHQRWIAIICLALVTIMFLSIAVAIIAK